MDFSSIQLPTQLTDPLAKLALVFIVLLIICHVLVSYIPRTIPSELRGIIGIGIITIFIIATYKMWPYIPVLF